MAILTPDDSFDDVYKLETADPVKAGTVAGTLSSPTDGHTNAPIQSLTNRTEFLYYRMLPIGTVLPYVGTAAPTGFLICNGVSVNRAGIYANLFAVCGTKFGTVNGSEFNIPDLRGQFIRGWDDGAGVDPDAASRSSSAFGGASGDNIGSEQGDAFEAHTHDVPYSDGNIAPSSDAIEETPTTETNTKETTSVGGNETRPTNIAMNYIIKAVI